MFLLGKQLLSLMAGTAGSPKYIHQLRRVHGLSDKEREVLEAVEKKFAFRSNEYYLSLIDWEDPDDPIRRIVVPTPEELEHWGTLDASEEIDYTIAPGLQHKYDQTAVLLLSDQCGGFCRFCFRKRLFMEKSREVVLDISSDVAYIREHPEITNVLLTGGDPLFISTKKLTGVIGTLREIDHVRIIRIGSKIPAYNPYRIINDPALLDMIRTYSTAERRIYVMTQFNHPREITSVAASGNTSAEPPPSPPSNGHGISDEGFTSGNRLAGPPPPEPSNGLANPPPSGIPKGQAAPAEP